MLQNSVSRRSLILISLSLLVLAAMTIVLAPKGAQANEGVPIKGNFTVAFAFITNSNACGVDDTCMTCINNSGDYIEAQGIGGTSNQGTLFLEVQKCLNPAGGLFGTYAGTFTMTAPNGKDSFTGMYSGKNDNTGASISLIQPRSSAMPTSSEVTLLVIERRSCRLPAS